MSIPDTQLPCLGLTALREYRMRLMLLHGWQCTSCDFVETPDEEGLRYRWERRAFCNQSPKRVLHATTGPGEDEAKIVATTEQPWKHAKGTEPMIRAYPGPEFDWDQIDKAIQWAEARDDKPTPAEQQPPTPAPAGLFGAE